MQNNNPSTPYSVISFMMRVLNSRAPSVTYTRTNDVVFHLCFDSWKKYTFVLEGGYITSEARVRELHLAFPTAQYIVIGTNWGKVTKEAYAEARDCGVKILSLKQFIASLHKEQFP